MYFQNESVPKQAKRMEAWENGAYQKVAADWVQFSTKSLDETHWKEEKIIWIN